MTRKELLIGYIGMMLFVPFLLIVFYAFMCIFGQFKLDPRAVRVVCIVGAIVGLLFGIAYPKNAYKIAKLILSGF